MSDDPVNWPYDELGLDTNGGDTKTVKRAYARRLKTIDQAKDPAGFQALREAYEYALAMANHDSYAEATPVVVSSLVSSPEPLSTTPATDEDSIDPVASTPDTHLGPFDESALSEIEQGPKSDSRDEVQDSLGLSNEDHERWQALQAELQDLLDQPFDNARWAALTRDPLLDIFEFANEMEHHIFGGVFNRMETREDGEQILPPFVTPRWIELIDQRFGWTQDLPLFRRKFGWHGGNLLPLLTQRAYSTSTQPLPVQEILPVTNRRSWMERTVLLCAGYTLIRAIVVVILP